MKEEIFVINLLEDKEFDKLPYKNISDSLGIADRETGNAFIRKTGLGKEFDAMTIQHEIQHLIETNNTHADEYGILHKKFKDVMRVIAAPLIGLATGGLGSILGLGTTMAPLVGGAAGAIAGGAGAGGAEGGVVPALLGGLGGAGGTSMLTGAIKGGTAAAPGFMSKAAGITKGTLGMTPAAIYPAGTPAGVTNMGTFSQFPGGSAAGVAAAPLSTAAQTLKVGQSVLGSPNVIGQGAGQISKQAPLSGQPTPPPSPFKITPTTALGGASLLGAMGTKQPEFQMPPSVEEIRQKLLAGGQLTPVGLQAQTELANILKSTPQELYPTANDAYYEATLRRTRESYANALEELDKAYNRAGVYGSGEHLAERASMQEELARTESSISAEIEQRRFELARTQKYQAVQDALNVDKGVMDDLVGLTGLDVQTAAMVYGAKVEDVQQIREALGTLGVEMILRGSGFQQQPSLGNLNITLGR